jgi:hypothetical protein
VSGQNAEFFNVDAETYKAENGVSLFHSLQSVDLLCLEEWFLQMVELQ